MLDSDFWGNLAERFRRLDPDGILKATWSLPFGSQSSEIWELVGTGNLGPSIRAQFEPLATKAGLMVDMQSRHPIDLWLSTVRASGPQFDFIGSSGSAFGESGLIKKLCQVSADVCSEFEARALLIEHGGDPANETIPLESDGPAITPTGDHQPESSLPATQHEIPSAVNANFSEPESQTRTLAPTFTLAEQRKKQVSDFLEKCNEISDLKIFRKHIWQQIGHTASRQFEYWQKGDSRASAADDKNFYRVLKMPPENFIASLKVKKLLK